MYFAQRYVLSVCLFVCHRYNYGIIKDTNIRRKTRLGWVNYVSGKRKRIRAKFHFWLPRMQIFYPQPNWVFSLLTNELLKGFAVPGVAAVKPHELYKKQTRVAACTVDPRYAKLCGVLCSDSCWSKLSRETKREYLCINKPFFFCIVLAWTRELWCASAL